MHIRMMRKLEQQDILIFDDFSLQSNDPLNSDNLMVLLKNRYNAGSKIITSQVPVNKWYDLIQEKTLADATMPASQ